ncbi:MAG: hypothetical protein N2379_10130, partial [Verrucomicrobiae bacterium]|nr:hypothetical protein [Verrucomicrobiae bacterium]
SKPIPIGTLKSIIEGSGLPLDAFWKERLLSAISTICGPLRLALVTMNGLAILEFLPQRAETRIQ